MKPYFYDCRTMTYIDEYGNVATTLEQLDTINNTFQHKADAFLKHIPRVHSQCKNCGAPKTTYTCDYCKS